MPNHVYLEGQLLREDLLCYFLRTKFFWNLYCAHQGNFQDYFARYTKNAVFFGTDKTERWNIEQFKAYARPAFADGHGWTYKVVERNWEGNSNMRWFDEILFNEKLGHCRGTGVVQLINDEWKIAHYALTMLVPNSIAADVGFQTQQADSQ